MALTGPFLHACCSGMRHAGGKHAKAAWPTRARRLAHTQHESERAKRSTHDLRVHGQRCQ
eukprot:2314157-Alexandrium_andersonii.AAC.1